MAQRGHELGNHSLIHPCRRFAPDGARMVTKLPTMNTLLRALDGKLVRTCAYTCSDHIAGQDSFVDALGPLFVAARGGTPAVVADLKTLDLHLVPGWGVRGVSGDEMIAFVNQALHTGGLAVFMFHGVGGGHDINVDRAEHQQLLAWLAANRPRIWTGTFLQVMQHIARVRSGKALPAPVAAPGHQ